jgi:hypothetical protein
MDPTAQPFCLIKGKIFSAERTSTSFGRLVILMTPVTFTWF